MEMWPRDTRGVMSCSGTSAFRLHSVDAVDGLLGLVRRSPLGFLMQDGNQSPGGQNRHLRLFAGACRADEHLQLDSELLIFAQNLIELLHEVLGFSSIWQIL
ncbi:hypothetical protein EYF80_020384 [Liparis tanakae]|uniref:Uncharacterized protein n=1 Tax=Liparis tanakae TaxID=230148 RepID=A0A4Z2HWM7_9TELE|nr:hypothetical protein EYF80_020384 [Liparis tanakae]